MPIEAYILVKLRAAPLENITERFKKFEEIVECSMVTGEIDIIIKAVVKETKDLFELVKKIRDVPEVLSTMTSIVISKCK